MPLLGQSARRLDGPTVRALLPPPREVDEVSGEDHAILGSIPDTELGELLSSEKSGPLALRFRKLKAVDLALTV